MSPRPLSHSSERPCQAALWSQGRAITPLRIMRLSPLTAVPRQRCAFQMKAPLPKATTPPRQQEEGAPKGCVISLQSGRGGSPSEKGTCVGVIKNKGLECVQGFYSPHSRGPGGHPEAISIAPLGMRAGRMDLLSWSFEKRVIKASIMRH